MPDAAPEKAIESGKADMLGQVLQHIPLTEPDLTGPNLTGSN